MAVEFSQFPGRHERHYRRRLANPLFPGDPVALDQEVLLEGDIGRVRDVRQGPDGLIYLLTDETNGALYRLEPIG